MQLDENLLQEAKKLRDKTGDSFNKLRVKVFDEEVAAETIRKNFAERGWSTKRPIILDVDEATVSKTSRPNRRWRNLAKYFIDELGIKGRKRYKIPEEFKDFIKDCIYTELYGRSYFQKRLQELLYSYYFEEWKPDHSQRGSILNGKRRLLELARYKSDDLQEFVTRTCVIK